MPQDLFKWQDMGGLKHHCPICQTPLSHDKCRTICLGNHVEWCHRYHALFRMNWSSRCSACKTTDEQHEKRHREIAEILAKIKKFKAEEEAAAMELLASPTAAKTPRTPLTAKALNSVGGATPSPLPMETPKLSKKQRKAAKKAVKSLDREKVITTADIEFVAKLLHPKSEKEMVEDVEMEEVDEDMEIKMHLKFNKSTCNAKSARHDFIIRDRTQIDIDNSQVENLLVAMDVDPRAIGKEGELVRELSEAIKNDLVHYHDELKIVARNKGGFWRWANKRAYRDLVENGKDWDAKHSKDGDHALVDERRPSEQSVDAEADDEAAPSRSGSIGSSAAPSVATALTVPSTKASSKKRASDAHIEAPSKKKTESDDGWTQVGKKVLKPPPKGKLTLSSNGGLHHLAVKSKKNAWSLPDLE